MLTIFLANGSWDGHVSTYEQQRKDLIKLLQSWRNDGCDKLDKIGGLNKKQIEWVIQEAEYWANKPAPKKPDNADSFELPQITIPAIPKVDVKLDWLWQIFRNIWGNEQRV